MVVLLWKELVGALYNQSQRMTVQRPRVTNLLPGNIDIQRRYEERGGRGGDQIQESSTRLESGLSEDQQHLTHARYRAMQCFNTTSSSLL